VTGVRAAVVGHVEWVRFAVIDHFPHEGEIVEASEWFDAAAGSGAVAAVQLRRLGARTDFFTALGDDPNSDRAGDELTGRHDLRLRAARRPQPLRRGFTQLDDHGERTITVIGDRLVPLGDDPLEWSRLAEMDGVYFTGGDVDALRAARAARVLTATPRTLDTLRMAGVELDALVGSGRDAGERYERGDVDPLPKLYVATLGREGGVVEPGGPFAAPPLPGPVVDTYGAGDSFAAGLTYGLAARMDVPEAVALAVRCGAAALTGRGAIEGQLRL